MAQSWLADVLWMMGPKHLAEAVHAYRAAYAIGSASLRDLAHADEGDQPGSDSGAASSDLFSAEDAEAPDDVFDTLAAIDYYTDTCAAAHGGPCDSLFETSSIIDNAASSPSWAGRLGYGASWRLWHLHRLSLGLRKLGDFAASAGHVRTVLRMLGSVSRVASTGDLPSIPPAVSSSVGARYTSMPVVPGGDEAMYEALGCAAALGGSRASATAALVVCGSSTDRMLDTEAAWTEVMQRIAADVARDALGMFLYVVVRVDNFFVGVRRVREPEFWEKGGASGFDAPDFSIGAMRGGFEVTLMYVGPDSSDRKVRGRYWRCSFCATAIGSVSVCVNAFALRYERLGSRNRRVAICC